MNPLEQMKRQALNLDKYWWLKKLDRGEWVYGVTYIHRGKEVDKMFTNQFEAEAFYQGKKRNLERAVLFRTQRKPLWLQLWQAHFRWFGRQVKLRWAAFGFLVQACALYALWSSL